MLNIGSACCVHIGVLRSSSELIQRMEKRRKKKEGKKRILEFLALLSLIWPQLEDAIDDNDDDDDVEDNDDDDDG